MKSQTVALLLSTLSLAGVALLHVRLDRLEEKGSLRRSAAGRTPVVEERVEVSLPAPRAPEPVGTERAGGGPAGAAEERTGSIGGTVSDDSLEAVVERVVRRKLADRDRAAGSVEAAAPVRLFGSVDQMARELELSPAQQDRVRSAVERTRQRMDDVLRIPDETGKSPFERKTEREEKMRESLKNRDAGGAVMFLGGMLGDLRKKIPGRETTYGGELDRIRKEGKEEIGSVLDPKQKESFDRAQTDPLFGNDGAMSISFFADAGETGGLTDVGEAHVVTELVEEVEVAEDAGGPPPAPSSK
jgi:hypothetical protein